MHDAYLNAVAWGLLDALALVVGELDDAPQAVTSNDPIETTTVRMRFRLRLAERLPVRNHIGR